MNLNVDDHFGTVDRSVSSRERDGQAALAVIISRSYATTVADLWDALTNGDRLRRWFLPVSGELELGGRYQLEGNAGGVITACDHRSHFALTWEFGAEISWVEAHLLEHAAGQTLLTLEHIQLPSDHWDTYGPGATGVGWELSLLGLALHIRQPSASKPDAVAFTTSASGNAFIKESCELWGKAAIAFGMDPEASRAAARRTSAFYTGESAEHA